MINSKQCIDLKYVKKITIIKKWVIRKTMKQFDIHGDRILVFK